MVNSDSAVQSAYAECRRLARKHYENFPVASYLVPRDKRDALAAIYAFARGADDIADEFTLGDSSAQREPRLARLAEWRRLLKECLAGQAEHPVFIALSHATRKFDLSSEHFEDLIRAFESDVRVDRHEDFASLQKYCTCSANPVGRLVLELSTPRDRRDPVLFELSDHICTALQLANFWQDVRIDLARDRSYLPLEDLRRFDLSVEEVKTYLLPAQASPDERWKRLMAFEVERTRELFERGSSLPDRAQPGLRVQLRLTWLGGMTILSKVEAVDYDVFRHRPSLSGWGFFKLYLRARGRRPLEGSGIGSRAEVTSH